MEKRKWIYNWRVIDLLKLVKEIGGKNYQKHPIYKEWEYQVENRAKSNDSANLEWVAENEETPLINEFLLSNGFSKGEMVLFYVSW